MPGSLPIEAAYAAHIFILAQLLKKVVEIEAVAFSRIHFLPARVNA